MSKKSTGGTDPFAGHRDEHGRIKEAEEGEERPGRNLTGKGGWHQRKIDERWVQVIKDDVSVEDVRAIVAKAVEQAKRGNRFARDFLWDRAVGKPRQIVQTPGGDSPLLGLFAMWMGHPEMAVPGPVPELGAGDNGEGEVLECLPIVESSMSSDS